MHNFIILILLFRSVGADKNVLPAFLIDSEGVMKHLQVEPNPFYKMSTMSFANIIHETIKRSEAVIIFIEDTFCFEDITMKDNLGTPYHHLRQGLLEKQVTFFPAVMEPYKLLNQIFQPQEYNVFYLSSNTNLQLKDNSKYFYIYFQDGGNETRVKTLRRHDTIMKKVYFAIRQIKAGPIVAFYTGKWNPIDVEKLQFVPIQPVPAPNDLDVTIISEGGIFRFSKVYAATAMRRSMFKQMPIVAEETWTRKKLATKMAYTDFELQFNFDLAKDDAWTLENVALLEGGEEVGRTELAASAPWNWSFVCGEPLVLVNTRDGSSVTISQYQHTIGKAGSHYIPQIQPDQPSLRNGSDNGTSKCFGPTVNCGPYFNTAILSGLFVSFLCLGILAHGFTMLYNCNNNDRYDDPSSKPLVTDVR